MSLVRLLARRVAVGFIAIWTFLTIIFSLFTLTRDWVLEVRISLAAFGGGLLPGEIEQIRNEYLAARGLDRPTHELYIDWMTNMLTLQWGESFQTGEEVFPAIMSATAATGRYVLPGMVFAVVVGLGIGVYTALYDDAIHAGLIRAASYGGLGLPFFWVGGVILAWSGAAAGYVRLETVLVPVPRTFVFGTALPALLVGLVLTAAVVSYSRAYARQTVSAATTKLVRAKGGGPIAVGRHAVRNAAIPLVSLVFVETFALLALSVFVLEALFGIDGLGLVIYNAIWQRDLPMILGASLVVVVIGVVGNVLQDLAYSLLDPRVDTGTR